MESRERPLAGLVPKDKGFTLVELVVTFSVLIAVTGGVTASFLSSQRAFADLARDTRIRDSGIKAMQRLSEIIPNADRTSVIPTIMDDATVIAFRPVVGHDGTNYTLGPINVVGHVGIPGEIINGADDNGDGRIDEGYLVWIQTGSPLVRVCSDIVGVRFNNVANGISFEIDVAVGSPSGVEQQTFTRQVTFRAN